jgi:hypothetical protein
MPGIPWTKEQVKKAVEATKESTSRQAAAELVSKRTGRKVTIEGLDAILRREGHRFGALLATANVPEGHRVKGNSTLVDGAGNVDARWIKTQLDPKDPPKFEPVGKGFAVQRVSSYVDSEGKVAAQWVSSDREKEDKFQAFWTAAREAAEEFRGLVDPVPAPAFADSDLLNVFPLGDPHLGMLAWAREVGQDFDLQIATADLYRTVDLLCSRAPAAHTGLFLSLGDLFHADNQSQMTPGHGNKLDVDSRHPKIIRAGLNVSRRCIDRMLSTHRRVLVSCLPGNHDPESARMLGLLLEVLYEREPRVQVIDNVNPYMYHRHGKCLIGAVHGDGPKIADLAGIMSADRPKDWGETEYRYWYTGHIHHKSRNELYGCVQESFRTLAGRDAWHHGKGYRSGQSLDVITLHSEYGEIARSTVDLKLSRAAA